jgi:predicted tellurium resistance membrane protein TerC
MELFSTAWWSALMAIILIDLVLAGDHAIGVAVIGVLTAGWWVSRRRRSNGDDNLLPQ